MKLEGDFENAVAKGGGKAFASWFADDAVTLNNGQPAVQGQLAIAGQANWDPKTYQLTWYAEGARMGPSGDTGFTWGHYEAQGQDAKGQPTSTSGRYITVLEEGKRPLEGRSGRQRERRSAGDAAALRNPQKLHRQNRVALTIGSAAWRESGSHFPAYNSYSQLRSNDRAKSAQFDA